MRVRELRKAAAAAGIKNAKQYSKAQLLEMLKPKASKKRSSLADLAAGIPVGNSVDLKDFAERHNVRVDSLRTVVTIPF